MNERTPIAITPEDEDLIDKLKSKSTIFLLDSENVNYPTSGIYDMKLANEGYSGMCTSMCLWATVPKTAGEKSV